MSLEIRLCEPDFISPVSLRPRQVPLPPKSMPGTPARFSPLRICRPHAARFSSGGGDGRETRPGRGAVPEIKRSCLFGAMKNGKNREACLDEGRIFLGFHMVRSSIEMQRKWNREEVLNSRCLFICVNVRASAVRNFFFRLGGRNQYKNQIIYIKYRIVCIFLKIRKFEKRC